MKYFRIDNATTEAIGNTPTKLLPALKGKIRSAKQLESLESWFKKRYGEELFLQITHVPCPKDKVNQKLIPIFDRAHGLFNQDGTPYQGKASPAYNYPDKFPNDQHLSFREAEFSEDITDRVCALLDKAGYMYKRLIPDDDMHDRSNNYRHIQLNNIAKELERDGYISFIISNHANAAKNGDVWTDARGACVWTYYGESGSDKAMSRLYYMIEKRFPEWAGLMRKDMRDGDPDIEAGFYCLTCYGLAGLIEWGFQDNKEDVALLLNSEFRQRIAQCLFDWIDGEIRLY